MLAQGTLRRHVSCNDSLGCRPKCVSVAVGVLAPRCEASVVPAQHGAP